MKGTECLSIQCQNYGDVNRTLLLQSYSSVITVTFCHQSLLSVMLFSVCVMLVHFTNDIHKD